MHYARINNKFNNEINYPKYSTVNHFPHITNLQHMTENMQVKLWTICLNETFKYFNIVENVGRASASDVGFLGFDPIPKTLKMVA